LSADPPSAADGAFPLVCASTVAAGGAEGDASSIRGLVAAPLAVSTLAALVRAALLFAALLLAAPPLAAPPLAAAPLAPALRAVVVVRRCGVAGGGAAASSRSRCSTQFAHASVPVGIQVSQTNSEHEAQNR
jgi:hypothetical protein